VGGSVGDSGAWIVTADELVDLTACQARKPLLGSGISRPVAFGPEPFRGRLLLATDGLFKYATRDRILSAMKIDDPESAAALLIDAARLKSGALQDDVGLLLCYEAG
jgi:PPM family protein phosphatase